MMYGLLVGFLLLVLFKISNGNCIIILIFFTLFSSIIFYQLIDFKKKANEAFCPFCKQESLCMLFCQSNISTKIISIFIAMGATFSMMAFLYSISYLFLIIIFIDIFILLYLYRESDNRLSTEFSINALGFFKELSINFINISFLTLFFVIFSIYTATSDLQLSPELFDKVIQDIKHECIYFQHFVRTTYFFDLVTQSLMNIEGFGTYIYIFIYIITLSLLPFFTITLIFKFSFNWINPKIIYLFIDKVEHNNKKDNSNENIK